MNNLKIKCNIFKAPNFLKLMIKIKKLNNFTSKKILPPKKIASLINKLKSRGKIVGLCQGGFDLLHHGHIKHFELAKKLCDVLVVSITSDKFVSSRKGLGRPIYTDKIRAYMVASIECVDYVTISDFRLGVKVIRLLKPSIYIKGSDYINKTTPGIIAERNAIKEVGGEIRYTDSFFSTTEVINYIKNKIKTKEILICIDRDGTLIQNDNFFGQEKNWKKQIKLNDKVINFLSYLQTKYKTTKIVVSNQAGVARNLFNSKRVEEINRYLDRILFLRGIKIDCWEYCPFIDSRHALEHLKLNLNPKYIQEKTKRKPSPEMVFDGLKRLNKKIDDFDGIIVIGDREEDKELANKLKAKFVKISEEGPNHLLKEI